MIYELQSQYTFSNYDFFFLQVNIILNINDPVSYSKDYGIFEKKTYILRVWTTPTSDSFICRKPGVREGFS